MLLLTTVKLILFIKNNLFVGMVSHETYKAQMERERQTLQHFQDITTQLDDIMKLQNNIITASTAIAQRMEELARVVDESVVNQILRLSADERAIIRDLRARPKKEP